MAAIAQDQLVLGNDQLVLGNDQLVFENEEWLVTADGLEHKETGYYIDRDRLSDRRSDGLWSWPLHMAEKRWCTPAPFAEAFTCAAALYEITLDTDFARSLKAARCEVVGWPATAPKVLPEGVPEALGALRGGVRIPISDEAASNQRDGFERPDRTRQPNRERSGVLPRRARPRAGALPSVAALRWHASRPIRQASTRLVRLLQAALSRG